MEYFSLLDQRTFARRRLTMSVSQSTLTDLIFRAKSSRVFKNTAWLLLDKFLRLSIGLIVGTMVARHLGPENFGFLSYAIAFTALMGGMGSLGLDSIVVRNIVREPQNASLELGTALFLRAIGGAAAFSLAFLLMGQLRPDVSQNAEISALVGLSTAVKGLDVARFWFEANINSKFTAISESAAFIMSSFLKLTLVQVNAPLVAFAGIMLFESLISVMINTMLYRRDVGSIKSWRVSYASANAILRDCWPLALSGVAIIAYMKIDQIMLGKMSGDHQVGIYSAASRISEVWYLIPVIIGQSFYPVLIEKQKSSKKSFDILTQKLMDYMVVLSLAISIPVCALSRQIISILYGAEFSESSDVLMIHIFGSIFVFMGVIAGKWYLANGLQNLTPIRSLYGVMTNIILNFLLIPRYSVSGAAISMALSHFIGSYLANAFDPRTREVFMIQTKAIIAPARLFYQSIQAAIHSFREIRQH